MITLYGLKKLNYHIIHNFQKCIIFACIVKTFPVKSANTVFKIIILTVATNLVLH